MDDFVNYAFVMSDVSIAFCRLKSSIGNLVGVDSGIRRQP
jgi:hypothetical protein